MLIQNQRTIFSKKTLKKKVVLLFEYANIYRFIPTKKGFVNYFPKNIEISLEWREKCRERYALAPTVYVAVCTMVYDTFVILKGTVHATRGTRRRADGFLSG